MTAPVTIRNLIAGNEVEAAGGETIEKRSPATGEVIAAITRSTKVDVDAAVAAATDAQRAWADRGGVERGGILRRLAELIARDTDALAEIIAAETGKAPMEARGEVGGAIELGHFIAGEGRRMYGRTTNSAVPNRQAMTLRQPLGVAGLIVAANTPIANVTWKVFPALVCGNAAVLKAAEDTPETALAVARLASEAGVPDGVLNVIQGLGDQAGQPLVEHPGVAVISFIGSTAVGRAIARIGGERLAKVSLELGGKNPLVVCDDADLDGAAEASVLSAFSNAGQRCAAGSRLLVFDAVYDEFRERLLAGAAAQRVGPSDEHDFGPVINERGLERMLAAVGRAREHGAEVLCGGERLTGPEHADGFYVGPTVVEGAPIDSEISSTELFGPIATLHRVSGFDEAVAAANASPYGLTAAIWTANFHRAQRFVAESESGVVSVNGPTYGSEPHMPFGGLKDSGNGWREPGTEAIDVYSELKTVYLRHDPELV